MQEADYDILREVHCHEENVIVHGWKWGRWWGITDTIGAQCYPFGLTLLLMWLFLPSTPAVSLSFSAFMTFLEAMELAQPGNRGQWDLMYEAAIHSTNGGEQLMADGVIRTLKKCPRGEVRGITNILKVKHFFSLILFLSAFIKILWYSNWKWHNSTLMT